MKDRDLHMSDREGVNTTHLLQSLSAQHFSHAWFFMAQDECTVTASFALCKNFCPRHVLILADTASASSTSAKGTSTPTSSTRSSRSTSCTVHSGKRWSVWSSGHSIPCHIQLVARVAKLALVGVSFRNNFLRCFAQER